MKKTILTLTFLVTQIFIFGQNYNTTLGIKLSPGIATFYNSGLHNDNSYRFSTTAGLEIIQRIYKDKLYIETGLQLFDRGSGHRLNAMDEYGNELGLMKSKEIDYYLTLPISLLFKSKGIFIGAGPNINYYLTRRFVLDGKLISTERSFGQDNYIFGAQFFLGYEMKLSDNFLISFDGYVNPTFKAQYLNYGIDIGLKYILINQKE